ncbi:mucin-5AC isoform X6 [Drosophila yakuba]|uniref:mucin-5AC isoform X6 n=1 Tax=Drosophila yakuba TaxID=7245 RepID=UPI001930890B|nr:mucin-5AC isoform X6 [Drosophila yakuba]
MLPFRRGAAWQTLFLLCALAYCINEASSEGRVVCYYTNWSVYRPGTAKFNPQNINPYLCTHLVYAFGGFTKDNQMKPFDKYQDIEQGGYAKFTGLKTYNKQLKTMIAIGGWNEASSRFSPLVASNERRQQFIKNILKFLRQNHFDGIDLDWEYPAHREGGKSRDRDNYAQFVQELRAEFEREAEKTGRTRLLLTMAVPAGIEYIDKGYDVPKLNKYLDWFNVLTYDFHSSHEPSVNHHAPLYSLEEDSEYNYDAELNIDYSIKYYLKAGADRDKLVLGIPTYGRSYTLINEESTELGAPAEGPGEQGDATREKGYLAYYEICQTLKDDPEWTVVQPNANVMGPYAYRRNQWVGYDDEAIVRKKAEYVVAQGLGGIMFWAIDNDDFRGTCNGKPYPLIEAAKEAMVEALGLGINEVAKPSGPQKPSRSRSRDNASTRNRLNGKTEAPPSSRRPSATRRPTVSSTQPPPPSTTFKLTEAEGSSLYIGGRASTTPPPPTTPDPGSDFKCEEEGFFQHPRDCKKYYWCLDSGPSGLGIVAHMFTCPSGLYFNPAADSCDFARNVPCKTKKSTTAAPVTSTTPTTTTVRSNRVTAAPTARPVYPRTTTTTSTTTTTTTTTPASVDEDLEYEEDTDELSPSKSSDAEEDPQVIKELIDLIRKVGGVEQLEKHLLRNKDGSITLKENSATGAATTPSTISKSLYDRVLSRPGTLNSFSRNRFKISEATETSTEATVSSSSSKGPSTLTSNSNSKYSSVLRGNSRQGPQNEGIEKLAEFDGFLKERKQYVTINRHRSASQGDDEELADQQEEEENLAEVQTTTRRPLSSITPSYTSLRRARPTTVAPPAEESNVEAEQNTQTQVKSYATLSRTRGRTTAPPEVTEAAPSSTTNRYKYFERTRPTKSAAAEDSEDPTEDEEEEYEDEQKDIVTDQTISSTTQAPPPATTLLHVFTLLEGEGQEEEPTTRKPTVRLYPTIQTEVVPKHKLVEINRIVEINSKQAKASQRKSKANNDFGVLMVESLPHVEQLGEISVVKYVHLVDGSDIQINDGHSTVADYTPTEPTSAAQSPVSLPVRNSLPETEGADTDRSGKSLVPEVLTAALETSTISLEGLFDSARKGKQLSSNTIIGETEESTTIGSSSSSATETGETTTPAPTYLRQPATGSVSRRPVLSVRRRIINSPTLAAVEATTTQQPAAEPPTTTSKYSRLRSRPSATAAAAAAAAATTTTAAAATTAFPAATSAPGGRTTSNIYLSKLKAKSGAAAAAAAVAAAASGEAATLTPATSNISSSSSNSNDITQKQHKFQPASFALRRQFQTRRLTTFAPAANGDESATEVPRTQNPLFKRRLTLISTTPPSARTTNPPVSGLDTTTTLYLNDDDEDQVAKSSIHTSRFNQIPEQVRPSEEYDLALAPQPLKSTSTTASTTVNAPQPLIGQGIRRQLIPRPRRPQSTTSTPTATLGSSLRSTTPVDHSAPPLSRRQQSRRRPHKYIEVYSRPPARTAVVSATSSSQFLDEELPPVGPSQVAQRRRSGSILPAKNDPKVIVHGHGIIECRAQGNFPHPLNCRKFISCARFEETGGIVGWEYTCPKGLTYDGVGGMCTWSPSDQPCRD